MHTLLQDLRYSARQLIKSPGFTLTAVISLALGIGAATAVFSVIYAVLVSPYPYPAADRIVRLTVDSVAGSGDPVYLNGAEIQTLRQSPVVESVLASDSQALMLTGQDLTENVGPSASPPTIFRISVCQRCRDVDSGHPMQWTARSRDPSQSFLTDFGGNIFSPTRMSSGARCSSITRTLRS